MICGLPGFNRFDSLALEENGNICIGMRSVGFVSVISPAGELVRRIPMDDLPANICFGGPGRKTAFITLAETDRLGEMEWPATGLRLNFSA